MAYQFMCDMCGEPADLTVTLLQGGTVLAFCAADSGMWAALHAQTIMNNAVEAAPDYAEAIRAQLKAGADSTEGAQSTDAVNAPDAAEPAPSVAGADDNTELGGDTNGVLRIGGGRSGDGDQGRAGQARSDQAGSDDRDDDRIDA